MTEAPIHLVQRPRERRCSFNVAWLKSTETHPVVLVYDVSITSLTSLVSGGSNSDALDISRLELGRASA